MNTPTASLREQWKQSYFTTLYTGPIHPTHFSNSFHEMVRAIPPYRMHTWVGDGMHAIRFECGRFCAVELVTHRREVPLHGIVARTPLVRERALEYSFPSEDLPIQRTRVQYLSSEPQIEALPDTIFSDEFIVRQSEARDSNYAIRTWNERHALVGYRNDCVSIVKPTLSPKRLDLECWHMIASVGLIISTMSSFEFIPE
jgi:hypothetical protein